MELINAVKNGTVDIAWLSAGYTVSLVPEANAFKLSNFTAEQERKNGLSDLYNEIFQKKANSVYLGWGNPSLNFTLYSNVPIKTLADFKGKPIRVTPAYKDFVTALGASPVTIDPGEVYTALERNVVVGYGWQTTGIQDYGWDAKTKYIIDPPFYQTDVIGLVNKDKWNSLNDEQKKIMVNASIDMEKKRHGHVTVDLFVNMLKPKAQTPLNIVTSACFKSTLHINHFIPKHHPYLRTLNFHIGS